MSHTPGPWVAESRSIWTADARKNIAQAAGWPSQVGDGPYVDYDEAAANARLIAAAPDLLRAAENVVRVLGDVKTRGANSQALVDEIEAHLSLAIRAARGEAVAS